MPIFFLFLSFFAGLLFVGNVGGEDMVWWALQLLTCSSVTIFGPVDAFFQLFLPFTLLNPFLFLLHQACSYPVYSPVLCIHQFLPRLYVEEKIHEKVVRQRYDLVHIFCIPTPPLIASWFMYLTAKYTTKFLPSSCDFLFKAANWSNHICGRLLVTAEELRIAC